MLVNSLSWGEVYSDGLYLNPILIKGQTVFTGMGVRHRRGQIWACPVCLVGAERLRYLDPRIRC